MGLSLSFSAASRYLLSPYSYFCHYFMRLRPTDEPSALAFGDAFDVALNQLLETRDLAEAKASFNKRWSDFKDRPMKFSKTDQKDALEDGKTPWEWFKHKGEIMLDAYYEQVLPKIKKVIAIQEEISVKNTDKDEFTGKIDAIVEWEDGRIILLDNKTSSISFEDDSVQKSPQLGTYFEILKDKYKLEAAGYVVIPKRLRKKKKPVCEISVYIGNVNADVIDKTFNDYDKVLSGIKSGTFPCTRQDRKSGCCSMPWMPCPYQKFCSSNGKDTSGLEWKKK